MKQAGACLLRMQDILDEHQVDPWLSAYLCDEQRWLYKAVWLIGQQAAPGLKKTNHQDNVYRNLSWRTYISNIISIVKIQYPYQPISYNVVLPRGMWLSPISRCIHLHTIYLNWVHQRDLISQGCGTALVYEGLPEHCVPTNSNDQVSKRSDLGTWDLENMH